MAVTTDKTYSFAIKALGERFQKCQAIWPPTSRKVIVWCADIATAEKSDALLSLPGMPEVLAECEIKMNLRNQKWSGGTRRPVDQAVRKWMEGFQQAQKCMLYLRHTSSTRSIWMKRSRCLHGASWWYQKKRKKISSMLHKTCGPN